MPSSDSVQQTIQPLIDAPNSRVLVVLRDHYLELCGGMTYPQASAALLNLFEHWTRWKMREYLDQLARRNQAQHRRRARIDARLWIYMSQQQLADELAGLFGIKTIRAALRDLAGAGFIKVRLNPYNKLDRTPQYLFNTRAIHAALQQLRVGLNAVLRGLAQFSEAIRTLCRVGSATAKRAVGKAAERITRVFTQESSQESSTGESHAPVREERESDLPFAVRSRMNAYADFDHYKASLLKEVARIGVDKAMALLEERCFGRPDVRSWKYMLTTLRNEPAPVRFEPYSALAAQPASLPGSEGVDDVVNTLEEIRAMSKAARERKPAGEAAIAKETPAYYWDVTYHQLRLQLDRGTFDSLLREARYIDFEDGTYRIAVHSKYACEMLQHRLYRNVHRLLSDVVNSARQIAGQPALELKLQYEVQS